MIGKKNEDYIIHLGSIIKNYEAQQLIGLIDYVNNINAEEIKANFYKELTNNEINNINPIMISLLGIFKKTKEKIQYETIQIDELNQFISFKSIISNLKLSDGIYN